MTKPMKYKVGDRVRIRRDLNLIGMEKIVMKCMMQR